MSKTELVYVGPEFVVGIPARDLTGDDIERLAQKAGEKPDAFRDALLKTSIYRKSATEKKA